MTFAEQIKQGREEQNLTQEELAERLGVSRQAVSKWESGAARPQGANRAALCALFSLDSPDGQPRPARRGLTVAGWAAAAVLLLALVVTWLARSPAPAAPLPADPALQSVRFYDAKQEEVLPEALWYNTAAIESILVTWTGGSPDSLQLFFTPGGSETMEQTELLLTRTVLDGESCALLSAQSLHDARLNGDLSIALSSGEQRLVSDLYNIFFDPEMV